MSKNTIQLGLVGVNAAAEFDAKLEQCDPTETLYLDMHSEGGSVFEGFRIANSIEEWPGKVVGRVKVAAFSIASYIAMKCDEIEIAKNGFFMIHNPYTTTEGDDETLARDAKLLAEMKQEMIEAYAKRTGMSPEDVTAVMKKETYFGSQKAVEIGLADRVIEPTKQKAPAQPQNKMPSFVFAAMYAEGEADTAATPNPKGDGMSQEPKTPVALTPRAIRTKYPKASDAFVIKCMDEEMNMDDIGEEYAKSMEEENEELKAKVAAMEEELMALKAKAMEDEEEEPVAQGTTPVAQGNISDNSEISAQAKWDQAIQSFKSQGKSGVQAAMLANKKFPGLREQLLNN